MANEEKELTLEKRVERLEGIVEFSIGSLDLDVLKERQRLLDTFHKKIAEITGELGRLGE